MSGEPPRGIFAKPEPALSSTATGARLGRGINE